MTMPQDPDTDDCVWCDVCGEVKRKLNYRLATGHRSAVWICERCEQEEDADNEADALSEADALADPEARAAVDALQADFERAMSARIDYRHTMFRDHNCARCQDGRKACVQGDPNRCMWPIARND